MSEGGEISHEQIYAHQLGLERRFNRILLALIGVMLTQGAIAVWWAASVTARVAEMERAGTPSTREALALVRVFEERTRNTSVALERIERHLDDLERAR